MDLHKLDCGHLKEWAKICRAAGRKVDEEIPDTPIRGLGRLLMLKAHRTAQVRDVCLDTIRSDYGAQVSSCPQWWEQVRSLAETNVTEDEERQNQGALVLAISQYVAGQGSLTSFFPGMDAKAITRSLLALANQFATNTFSLTLPDLTNIGVAISPTVALINHSCEPNVAVCFPRGPNKGMHVVAFRDIKAGEEVLSSYIDVTLPREQRQQNLLKQYKFVCNCALCLSEAKQFNARSAVRCDKVTCPGICEASSNVQSHCLLTEMRLIYRFDTQNPSPLSHV